VTGHPLDGIPFHPYYSVKDTVGVVVFLIVFSAIVFFAPEGGGYFLEYNNFLPADPLKTPPHIAPVWYFTPFYSILRAMVWPIFGLDAKFWGVVAMGASVVIIAFLPWLDKSPVKSIRYRGPIYKNFLTVFVIAFVILGYLGTQPPSFWGEKVSQVCSLIYFGFFLLMPWYSKVDKFTPEPERVTM
jgi:ubiquinol-cytochrome c reductase cytochrome b subunit